MPHRVILEKPMIIELSEDKTCVGCLQGHLYAVHCQHIICAQRAARESGRAGCGATDRVQQPETIQADSFSQGEKGTQMCGADIV